MSEGWLEGPPAVHRHHLCRPSSAIRLARECCICGHRVNAPLGIDVPPGADPRRKERT